MQSSRTAHIRAFLIPVLLVGIAIFITACNSSDGSSDKSSVTLQALSALSSEVTLEWEGTSDNVTGYRIERSESGGDYEEVATVGASVLSYTDTGLTAGTGYAYRVWAVGASGDIVCSTEVEVSTLEAIVLTAQVVSSGGIDLSWDYTAGGEEGFRVERKTSSTDFAEVAELEAGEDSYPDTGLDAGTSYTYRVYAFVGDGDIANSDEVSATTEASSQTESDALIIDHTCIDLEAIPEAWITQAKEDLHIAYGHTSHGSQLTTGMTGLADWKGDLYAYAGGGTGGALDLRDSPFSGASDLGNPDREAWAEATRTYLDANPEVNVIIWSWCGQADTTEENIETYLSLMDGLETDYPDVRFVYMTGHLNGTGIEGNLHQRNEQIREYCREGGRVLYDFADIESYDPDGNEFLSHYADDACNYYSDTDPDANWAQEWQDSHVEGDDWYECSSAHSEPLNANMKAYAAWWLWARLAGWDGQ